MIQWVTYAMVYLGSILMVYNIYGFIKFARYVRELKTWDRGIRTQYTPVVLLICFLLGYLMVGFFGKPDLIIAGILFGGSVFVYTMYRLLSSITERVVESEHMEAELLAAAEISRSKSSFLASMSHEMRTPMNVIIGQDTIMLKDESLKPQTRERLEKIDISAHHMLDLINDVLNVNSIEAGNVELRVAPFSLKDVLSLIDTLAQSHCDEKGIAFRSETVGDVDITCLGDSLRLRQVLTNVLGNAIKYTPEGGEVSFRTEQSAEGGSACLLRFTVSDTGIGIDEAFLPRLFEPFAQEDASTTNRYGGSGLGLTITKKLVDMMGGEITATSEKGKGSTFVITVRLQIPQNGQPSAAEEPAPSSDGLAGRHILIVEDMDLNAELVADLLELEGISSERAENGQAAVRMFSESPVGRYDAILMDMRMPVMDGPTAARAIRALEREDAKAVPIIALTANASDEDITQSLEAGMNVHLCKPVDSNLLWETLKKMLPA